MNAAIVRLVSSDAGYGALILRVAVGLVLAAHGAQKLFGWFGGYGLEGTGQWMASIGLEPGVLMAFMAGSAEFFGGVALALGALTRLAALSNVVAMAVAAIVVHLPNGFFLSNGGYEYALTLCAASAALMVMGAGKCSVDEYLARYFAARH